MTSIPPAAPATTVGPLWRHGGFLKLWSGETLSQFGAQLSHLALPVLAVTILQATEWEVGMLNAVGTAAFLLIGLPAGAWIDRMLKRRVMIAADIVRAAALAVLPLTWYFGEIEIWHLYAVGAVLGVATVFFDVAYQSYVPILVNQAQISDANGKLESTAQIARIGGPAVGGVLLAIVAPPVVLIATSVTYAASFLFLLRIRDEEVRADPKQRMPLHREIAEGVAFVWRHPLLRRITAATAASNLFGVIAMTMAPLLILRELGLSPAVMGLIFSVGAAGGLLGAVATPRIAARVGEGTIIPVALALGGAFTLLMPLAAAVPALAVPTLIVAEFGFSFSVLVYNISQVSFRQRVCPPRLLGRMNASIRCVVWGVMPIGALAAGGLGAAIGVVPTMWIGAAGSILATGFVAFSPLAGMRKLPEA